MYIQLYNQKINYCLQVSLLCLLCVRRLGFFSLRIFHFCCILSLSLISGLYDRQRTHLQLCYKLQRSTMVWSWCGACTNQNFDWQPFTHHIHTHNYPELLLSLDLVSSFTKKMLLYCILFQRICGNFTLKFSSNSHQQKQIKSKLLYFRPFFFSSWWNPSNSLTSVDATKWRRWSTQ